VGSMVDEVIGFFNSFNPSSRIMALGSTQSPTEASTRSFAESKGRPASKAGLSPLPRKTWEPRRVAVLLASTACYCEVFRKDRWHESASSSSWPFKP
jgi:hypothetical protein